MSSSTRPVAATFLSRVSFFLAPCASAVAQSAPRWPSSIHASRSSPPPKLGIQRTAVHPRRIGAFTST
eukprot:4433726-Lingulodinium_polyedra.AAC.1